MRFFFLVAVMLSISGCGATLQTHRSYSKPVNVLQTASIGGEVFRLKKQRDLPNAFGKADIFGGKVDAGFTELRYMGLAGDGLLVFRLTDIAIESNETTMSRYGSSSTNIQSNTNANAHVYGNSAYGAATTNTTIRHYDKPTATVTQLPPNTVEFKFDPTRKLLELDGVTVEVVEFTEYSIKYILHTQQNI